MLCQRGESDLGRRGAHATTTSRAMQEASCYTLQITANGAGFDSVKHQLTAAEPVGGAVYASLHRCFHGILFPETAQVASVTYVVDPAAPVLSGERTCRTLSICGHLRQNVAVL